MWTFNRSQGKIIAPDGQTYSAYSGHGEGVNNPALESVHNVGPIPGGLWDIGAPQDTVTHGSYVLPLTPHSDTVTYGRSGFLIHGDSLAHAGERTASLGCVIVAHTVRVLVWSSGDHVLRVS